MDPDREEEDARGRLARVALFLCYTCEAGFCLLPCPEIGLVYSKKFVRRGVQ
jgi:hypothetical protein